ncbi:MAG: sulfatase [Planctomycetes bacterium]|nr:sulfatase [Planctomycetota bacterium]
MIFGAAALAFTLASLLQTVERSGAVPPAEFAPAAVVFRAALPLAVLAVLLLVLDLALALRRRAPRIALRLAAGLVILASVWFPGLLPLGILIGVIIVLGTETGPPLRLPAPARWSRLLATWGLAVLALVPAVFLLVGLEWLLRGRGFVARGLVAEDLVVPYLGAAAGYAASAVLKCALSLLRVLALSSLALLLLRRLRPTFAGPLATWLVGLIIVQEQVRILLMSLRDEVAQLDLEPHLGALAILAFLFGQPLVRNMITRCHDLADLPRALALIPGGSAPRRGLLINTLVLIGFLPLLYPGVEDYRERFFDCVALFAMLFSTSLLARLGLPRLARLWPLALLVLLAGLIAFFSLGRRPDLRLIAYEYSRFGGFGASAPWDRWVATSAGIGFAAPATVNPWAAAPDADSGRPSGSAARPPILLFLWDAARPDRMSLHGYDRRTTPALERLAASSAVFDLARSTATATTLGVRNMLSGRYNSRFMLATDHPPFLVSALAARGYDDFFVTVTDNDFNGISDESFLRGWDSAAARPAFHFETYPNRDHIKPDAEKIADLLDHLDRRLRERGDLDRLFAYVHLTGTHTPWRNDQPVVDYGSSALDRYDGEMRKLDALLDRVLRWLEERGQLDDCVVMVTADHGTGLGEHGRLAGFLPYEEQLRIPLLLHVPGGSASRIEAPVANIDIAPTLLALAGTAMPGDGRSLLPLLAGGSLPPRPLVAFCAFQDSYAVFDPEGRFKLHHHRGRGYEALFDLGNDPRERENLVQAEPARAAELRAYLENFLWQGRARYGNPFHYRAWRPAGR